MSRLSSTELRSRRAAASQTRRKRIAVGALLLVGVLVIAATALVPSRHDPSRRSVAMRANVPLITAAYPRALVGNPRAGHHQGAAHLARLTIGPLCPGIARVFMRGPARREVALTIDDGMCATCIARILHTLAKEGASATIFPTGRYSRSWDPLATTIRYLVASGRLTIGNHTFLHHDPLEESAVAFRTDLADNELWIERTFGVSARPFFRPPYGAYDAATLAIAGELGYTKVVLWSGTVADSSPRTIAYIVHAVSYWARAGAIILMHGNYPATSLALPQILAVLRRRHLRPVTLAQLLGT